MSEPATHPFWRHFSAWHHQRYGRLPLEYDPIAARMFAAWLAAYEWMLSQQAEVLSAGKEFRAVEGTEGR